MAGRGDVSDEDQDIDIESDVSMRSYHWQIACFAGFEAISYHFYYRRCFFRLCRTMMEVPR